jgi:hypothetical protein
MYLRLFADDAMKISVDDSDYLHVHIMVFQVWLWLGCFLLQTTYGYILPTLIQNALHVLEEYDRSYLACIQKVDG